jgi:hypothetical protein
MDWENLSRYGTWAKVCGPEESPKSIGWFTKWQEFKCFLLKQDTIISQKGSMHSHIYRRKPIRDRFIPGAPGGI